MDEVFEISEEAILAVLGKRLITFGQAVESLIKAMDWAACPSLRVRRVEIAEGVVWPCDLGDGLRERTRLTHLSVNEGERYISLPTDEHYLRYSAAHKALLSACRRDLRRVWRAIQAIDQATEWCKRRTEGIERARREVNRQRRRILEKLKAEVTLLQLGE